MLTLFCLRFRGAIFFRKCEKWIRRRFLHDFLMKWKCNGEELTVISTLLTFILSTFSNVIFLIWSDALRSHGQTVDYMCWWFPVQNKTRPSSYWTITLDQINVFWKYSYIIFNLYSVSVNETTFSWLDFSWRWDLVPNPCWSVDLKENDFKEIDSDTCDINM